MALAMKETDSPHLAFGRDGADPAEWLTKSTFPNYTDEQKYQFLSLYIRTNRHDIHPIILESLILSWITLRDEIQVDRVRQAQEHAEEHLKGRGPRGRWTTKSKSAAD